MNSYYQYSYLRRAILVALLGTAGATSADTLVDKDTLIDDKSPINENYRVENGATLTARDATAGNMNIATGHLDMDGGHAGWLDVGPGGTASINNATINFAALQGDSRLSNTTVETLLLINDAQLSATNIRAQVLVGNGSDVFVENGYFVNGDYPADMAVSLNDANATFRGSIIKGSDSGIFIHNTSRVYLEGSHVWSTNGPAFLVNFGKQNVIQLNGSTAGSDRGELLTAKWSSEVSLSLNASHATGTIRAEDNAVVDVALSNGSHLAGDMINVNSLSLDNSSLYEMTANSDIKSLSMAGGTVKFAAGEEYGTLTLGTLSGSGHFVMNADVLTGKGDLLDISESATGKHTLHLAATGREATSNDALILVRTGAGNAEFALNGGRLDVGAWQQTLVRNGNNWELVHAGSTSASTDAMLAMASAPQFMHEGELNLLRSRLDDTALEPQSGMWATVLHSRSDVDGVRDSAYRLEQNGLMLGGDKVTELDAGNLSTGAYLSQSTGQVKHARGGKSRVTGYGGGLYASLTSDNGWYTHGSAQITRFSNKLSARMSDGGTARSDWNSWGYGLGMEAGRHIAVNYTTQLTPFAGLNGWLTPSESVRLNNGMTAETGDGRSLQAEAGLRFSTRLDVGAVKVAPYTTAALSQALVKNGSTQINETVDFTNDFTGTGGKLSGGVSVMLTTSARVWMEAGYAKSEHAESPLVGNVGLRVDF